VFVFRPKVDGWGLHHRNVQPELTTADKQPLCQMGSPVGVSISESKSNGAMKAIYLCRVAGV
jgi:hypothetical protein